MNVISASRRTDIPAFYWPWFMNRVKHGFCHWINPYNARQVFRVSLRPEDVAAFVFWTRNPKPMLPDIARLQKAGYQFYVQYTINGYPRQLERHAPQFTQARETLRRLRSLIGAERVIWRYDPIILSSATPPEYHFRQFARLASAFRGLVRSVYISFCDPYEKTRRRFQKISDGLGWKFEFGTPAGHTEIAERLAEISSANGLEIFSCAEPELKARGVKHGSCIDLNLLVKLRPDLALDLKAAPTRKGCGCVQAVDIGAGNTCIFGCEYCYANQSPDTPKSRWAEHDPQDSLLWRPRGLRGVNLDAGG